jgi:hypothetical protein
MSLPRGASQLPILALTFALRAWERLRRPRETWDRSSAEAEVERMVTKAHETAKATVAAAAPETSAATAERVTGALDLDDSAERTELPIPDFDHITLGSLRARLRSLSLQELATLRGWEKSHGHRAPVITLLDNRIARVASAETAAYPTDPQSST